MSNKGRSSRRHGRRENDSWSTQQQKEQDTRHWKTGPLCGRLFAALCNLARLNSAAIAVVRCLAACLSRSCIVTKRLKTRPMRIKNCTQGFEWYHFSMTLSDPSATFQGFNDSHSRAVSPRQLSFLSSKDGALHDTLTRFRSPSQSTKRSRTGDQRKLPIGLTQLLQSTGGGTKYGPLAAAASAINQTFERLV